MVEACNPVMHYLRQVSCLAMLPMPQADSSAQRPGCSRHEWHISLGAFSLSNSGNNLIFKNTSGPYTYMVNLSRRNILVLLFIYYPNWAGHRSEQCNGQMHTYKHTLGGWSYTWHRWGWRLMSTVLLSSELCFNLMDLIRFKAQRLYNVFVDKIFLCGNQLWWFQ